MTRTMNYRGYEGSIEFDPEDAIFHGKLRGIHDTVLYEGQDESALERNFHGAVDEYLRFCMEDGKIPNVPFSEVRLRLSPELGRQASKLAEERNLDLNAFVGQVLIEYFTHAK